MPAAATENRIADAILVELGKIGVVTPANWLTSPAPVVTEGVPGDPLPSVASVALLYLDFAGTIPADGEAATSTHHMRVMFKVWCLAKTQRLAIGLKADVLRALYAAEGALTTAFGMPVWTAAFTTGDEMKNQGVFGGALETFIDVEIDHAAP